MNRLLAMLAFMALPAVASAQVIITEVMYDLAEGPDGGREWIEVLNRGSTPVDLSAWKVFESGTNHKISGGVVPPGAYAIIADNAEKFRTDWPSFSGSLFDSAFSLNNDGETITLRDAALVDRDSLDYESGMGGDGTGDSLQRVESSFMPGAPSPGADVPESGLMPALKDAGSASESVAGGEVIGEREAVSLASAAAAAPIAWHWWLAPIALAAFASGGAIMARRRARDEWEIEETE